MTDNVRPEPAWAPRFIAALARSGCVRQAVRDAPVNRGSVYHRRRTNAEFAQAWLDALERAQASVAMPSAPEPPSKAVGRPVSDWPRRFIEALIETSNVAASATRVNVPVHKVYKLKRDNPQFAAGWLAALHEGYDQLEMELLCYLRDPRSRPRMDVAGAIRLLGAHRQMMERRRALIEEEDEDEQAMLESLDKYLADMRARRRANAAILIEAEPADAK